MYRGRSATPRRPVSATRRSVDQPQIFGAWGAGAAFANQGGLKPARPMTAGPSSMAPPADRLMYGLDKRKQLHSLESRIMEHDTSIRRYEARLRQQRAASLQQLKWAGQQLVDLHENDPRKQALQQRPSAEMQQLRRDYDALRADYQRMKHRLPPRTMSLEDEARAASQPLVVELGRLEQENAELRAALAARDAAESLVPRVALAAAAPTIPKEISGD